MPVICNCYFFSGGIPLIPKRLNNRSGQFVPMAMMLMFVGVVLLFAVLNIYRVTRAKLEAQNLADAVASAVASMEASSINFTVDRNEWLNTMYAKNASGNSHQVPNISEANDYNMGESKSKNYAQLVATVNKAQQMYSNAYNRFLGAEGSATSTNAGAGGLKDILQQIDGLNTPDVQVIVYNSNDGQQAADAIGRIIGSQQVPGMPTATSGPNVLTMMQPIPYKTEDVWIKVDGKNRTSLSKLLKQPDGTIGWVHPDWDDPRATMNVKTGGGNKSQQIGAGAVVMKRVHMIRFFTDIYVVAKASAYVVRNSGVTLDPNKPGKPPAHFKPTYYIRLAAR